MSDAPPLTRDALMEALQEALSFPSWFGRNWDAVWDCLCDLHWIPERRVVLWHEELPGLEGDEQRAYLEILLDAVSDWEGDPEHDLVVAFTGDGIVSATEALAVDPEDEEDDDWDGDDPDE